MTCYTTGIVSAEVVARSWARLQRKSLFEPFALVDIPFDDPGIGMASERLVNFDSFTLGIRFAVRKFVGVTAVANGLQFHSKAPRIVFHPRRCHLETARRERHPQVLASIVRLYCVGGW